MQCDGDNKNKQASRPHRLSHITVKRQQHKMKVKFELLFHIINNKNKQKKTEEK